MKKKVTSIFKLNEREMKQLQIQHFETEPMIVNCGKTVAVLKKNGIVIVKNIGENADTTQSDAFISFDNIRSWENIVKIHAGNRHIVGLDVYGKVYAAGDNTYGQCDVEDFTDIWDILAIHNKTIGVRIDDDILVAGDMEDDTAQTKELEKKIKELESQYIIKTQEYTEEVNKLADLVIGTIDKIESIIKINNEGIDNTDSVTRLEDERKTKSRINCNLNNSSARYRHIAVRRNWFVGIDKQGNVVSCEAPDGGRTNRVYDLKDKAKHVDVGGNFAVVLTANDKSFAFGGNEFGQCNIENWSNLSKIVAGYEHTVGLFKDGTAKAVGKNNGRQCAVVGWTDLIDIAAYEHTVGLRKDGTVVAVGTNHMGRCDVKNWRDIIQVSAGKYHTVGLKSDGTVVVAGSNNMNQCNTQDWKNIISIAAGTMHTVGLRTDGTVVAVGYNTSGQCNVSEWTDVVEIAAGMYHTVGIRSDGAVLVAGDKFDKYCRGVDWILQN